MREQRIATLNKPGKFQAGSRPTKLCLVAAGYAAGISSRSYNGASCVRCVSHRKLIHDFFRGKSDAEIATNYSGRWMSACARALLQPAASDTPPAAPAVDNSAATLQQSLATLTAQFASMSAAVPVPFNTDAADPFDRFRSISATTGCFAIVVPLLVTSDLSCLGA